MYKIGEFSRLCRVSVKTLRYYDELGILKPDYIDKFTGYRYYEASKLLLFNKLMALKEIGFSLDEIKVYFNSKMNENIMELINKKRQEFCALVEETQLKINRIDMLSDFISQEGGDMGANVIIKQTDDIKIVTERDVLKNRGQIAEKIDSLKNYLIQSDIKLGNLLIVINHDTEYCEENLDLEIGIEIIGQLKGTSDIKTKTIGNSDTVAAIICANTKDDIEKAYSSLLFYLDNNFYQAAGSFHEIYHDGYTVEIRLPVHKKSSTRTEAKNDNLDLPFEDDPEVTGRWELLDIVRSKEQFCLNKRKYTGFTYLKELYFLPEGSSYWCFGWTKGYLKKYTGDPSVTFNRYTIENINGEKYMFIEMKDGDYLFYNGILQIYVYKQTDRKKYSINDIRIYDNLDYTFEDDRKLIGKWKIAGYVRNMEEFNPYEKNDRIDTYWYQTFEFKDNGIAFLEYNRGDSIWPVISWTRGLILNKDRVTASAYELKIMDGYDYLFVECKNGDYLYGKFLPGYFVFRRNGG